MGEQVKSDAIEKIKSRPSKFVVRLLSKMKGEMTVLQMMDAVKLGVRASFSKRFTRLICQKYTSFGMLLP